jgi:hypothetical protein
VISSGSTVGTHCGKRFLMDQDAVDADADAAEISAVRGVATAGESPGVKPDGEAGAGALFGKTVFGAADIGGAGPDAGAAADDAGDGRVIGSGVVDAEPVGGWVGAVAEANVDREVERADDETLVEVREQNGSRFGRLPRGDADESISAFLEPGAGIFVVAIEDELGCLALIIQVPSSLASMGWQGGSEAKDRRD